MAFDADCSNFDKIPCRVKAYNPNGRLFLKPQGEKRSGSTSFDYAASERCSPEACDRIVIKALSM